MPSRKTPRKKSGEPAASRPHMPGYGLKDANSGTGLLPWSWALERLTKSHNYWIATTRPDGRPHIMIVWGLWFNDAFSFSTGRDSRKARNLAANPHCVLCTENAAEAVILEGAVEELPVLRDPPMLKSYILAYKKKYDYQMDGSEGNFYAVRPRVVFGLLEKDFLGATTRWQFPDG
jgi:hypothetical protein